MTGFVSLAYPIANTIQTLMLLCPVSACHKKLETEPSSFTQS